MKGVRKINFEKSSLRPELCSIGSLLGARGYDGA